MSGICTRAVPTIIPPKSTALNMNHIGGDLAPILNLNPLKEGALFAGTRPSPPWKNPLGHRIPMTQGATPPPFHDKTPVKDVLHVRGFSQDRTSDNSAKATLLIGNVLNMPTGLPS